MLKGDFICDIFLIGHQNHHSLAILSSEDKERQAFTQIMGLILLWEYFPLKSSLACRVSEPIFESSVELLGPPRPTSQTLREF